MLPGSQLTQAKLISDYLTKRHVVFLGDGDCMSLVLAVLGARGVIKPPAHMLVLDFDERILNFIREAGQEFHLPNPDMIDLCRYNVRDPVPDNLAEQGDVFYTNPPYGSADQGECGKIFLGRCMELCKAGSWGVAILPFEHHTTWTKNAMANIQSFLAENGYVVSEMIRGVHQYHLDDRPELLSGTVVVDRVQKKVPPYKGKTFSQDMLGNFYGTTKRIMPDFIDLNGEPIYRKEKPLKT